MDSSFLKEEERCGHLITSQMKKLWMVQIACLEELKKICERHNICYYVSGGTLLGTIRHKGYIPWDDDLDVVMFKEDYDRFVEIAKKELRHPYFLQHYTTNAGYSPGMSRIRNCETTCVSRYEYDMVTEDYNCGAFIDVFPMFGIEKSKFKKLWQSIRIFMCRVNIAGYEKYRKAILTKKKNNFLHPAVLWWMVLKKFKTHKEISDAFLRACSIAKKYEKVGLLSFSGFDERWIWEKEWYSGVVYKQFEYTEVSCPIEYDKVLRKQFGDYSVFKKGGAVHTMAICDPDTPYKEKLKDLFEKRKNRGYYD